MELHGGKGQFPAVEINVGRDTYAIIFSMNGELLVSGGSSGVKIWRTKDGKEMATMKTVGNVRCLAASKDGKWIAAGTDWGYVYVWDLRTRDRVFKHKGDYDDIHGVDFAPDSARLLVASEDYTAAVWGVGRTATRQRTVLGPLRHEHWVIAAKYSPQGDRIATATLDSIRVWDSIDGGLLADIEEKVTPLYNNGLLWSNDQLLVVSDDKIKQLAASTGLTVSDWQAPGASQYSCIALPRHGTFIAYAKNRTVTLWDTRSSMRANIAVIKHTRRIGSIALLPDDQFLAIAGEDGKITLQSLSHFVIPFIGITDTVLESWRHCRLAVAEALLTETISGSARPSYNDLASRALVRAHLRHWDLAVEDAENSIEAQPSAIGYIAKSVALIGRGNRTEGCRVFDLAFRHCDPGYADHLLLIKAVVLFMAGEHDDAVSRVDHLIATAHMHLLIGNSHMDRKDYEGALQSFESARDRIRHHMEPALLSISLISGWKFDHLDITIRQHLCEALLAAGRANEGGESLLQVVDAFEKEVFTSRIIKWVSDFTRRCLSTPATDTASKTDRPDSGSIILNPMTPTPLLREWARSTLTSRSWTDALAAAASFTISKFTVYRVLCERLETIGCMTDANDCFHQMVNELSEQKNMDGKQIRWVVGKLEALGDNAMNAERHDDAISDYTAALAFHPASPQGLLVKRSEAYVAGGSWKDALDDANKVIALDPSSPWGYERKHAAFHEGGDYESAIEAFQEMLSKMSQSSEADMQEQCRMYVNPEETKAKIRLAIQDATCELPRALINTTSGRLCDKLEQASAFESLPIFLKLISSMTTHVDHARIEQEVREYYRYATFSHKWEDREPLFEKVMQIVVYDLYKSPTHEKLQMFCKIVRDAGFHWAWSDTCCINKTDHFILQEALVAMFKWYQGSSVTIVFLRGVHSPSQRGDLVRNIWSTRAWTFQEYHASKVVRFYTEDWKPYLEIDIPNHKESPEIISEMEEATGISARALMALRPGLDNIREKLYLASRRETTYVEDSAYSLFGIFSISLPVVYGEGDGALGRFLAQLLTSSGDMSILAWTGRSGGFNTCLPASISVFNELPAPHIPPTIETTEMDRITTTLRSSSINLQLATNLYDRLMAFPILFFAGKRMKVSCLTFKLGPVSIYCGDSDSEYVFRAQTAALGAVLIKTKENLSRLDSLYLIHPWIDFLLDRHPVGGTGLMEMVPEDTDDQSLVIAELPPRLGPSGTTLVAPQGRATGFLSRFGRPFGSRTVTTPGDVGSLRPPSSMSQADKETRALQLVARLRQPFGALLLTPTRQNAAEYRRVASESMITVQVKEDAPLNVLIDNARMLDVL